MVSNLMIISITLLILVYYLYNLTDKIRSIDFNTISEGIGSVNQNLNNINLLGGKITPLIDQYQNSDISDLSVKKINFLTSQLSEANFQNFNIKRVDLLIDMLNETLYNFNNAILQIKNPNVNANFNPAFNSPFNSNFNDIDTDELPSNSVDNPDTTDTTDTVESASQTQTTPASPSPTSSSSRGFISFSK